MKRECVSFYDKTGFSLVPWVKDGYICFCYDITNKCEQRNGILFLQADLHDPQTVQKLLKRHKGCVKFMSAFPVCTDLCLGGAVHWERKRKEDPEFQTRAASYVLDCYKFAEEVEAVVWYIENPRGIISKHWRGADLEIHPCDYGGYLEEGDEHPDWPQYIASRDAYKKRTCIWHSSTFVVPLKNRVEPITLTCNSKSKGQKEYSPAFAKLGGGGGQKTKEIRSATPRGWAQAVWEANR
jgi:hypothetical protein